MSPTMTEPEVLARAMTLVAGLGGLGWAFFGLKFNFARKAAVQFGLANVLLVLGDLLSLARMGPALQMLDYYRAFNLGDVMVLGSVMLFRSGLLDLYDQPCSSARHLGSVAALGLVLMLVAHALGLQHLAVVVVLLVSAWFALRGFWEASRLLQRNYSRAMTWAFMWPIGAAGVLFLLRAGDDFLAVWQHGGDLAHTAKVRHLAAYMWGQLLALVLINASLIGQTLNALIKKLNDQTARLQHILDTAPVGVAVTTGGVVRFANPRLSELVSLQVGDPANAALVQADSARHIEARLADQGILRDQELQMYCPNHTVRDLLVTYMPTVHDGQPGTLSWLVDISERKRNELALQHASDEQNAIFDAATVGIAFIKDGRIVRANHRLEVLFAWPSGALLGQSPAVWFSGSDTQAPCPVCDLLDGQAHYSTQEFQRRDGSRFWCRLSGAPIDPQNLDRGTVWMCDDVTEERRAAELMRRAKDLAEEATRMKSNFLANMSHEIRTPMNAIIGMSQLALKTELSPKQRNYIEKVDGAARNLLVIINDILDFSKIEAGKLQFERQPFYLEDVLENLADLCVIKAQDKGLELLFDVAPDVPTALVGDALRLGQVLLNLVGNAIKFTERGEVTVSIRRLAPEQLLVAEGQIGLRFEVSDTGVGLSEEQRAKLFGAFTQADASTTRKYGGTGLGLTICKRLVELMDGEIDVHSVVGEGSVFGFTARLSLQTAQREKPVLAPDVHGLRVLVVDDNARAREIMGAILASQKFDAQLVASGAQALAALEAAQAEGRPYGLVLMDWMMPEEDGLSAIGRIRQDPRLHQTPAFVMVTAHSRDELLEQAGEVRIDGVLIKPVSPSALLDSILCALGKEVVTQGRRHQRDEANQDAVQKLRGAHLLLVEDNPVNQELALELLQDAGIRVDVAQHGVQALAMVKLHAYDGVLMDCQMPVMDGFEATRRMRADPSLQTLPILAMTANAMNGDRELCLAAGMNDHIGKPIDVQQLFGTLARWVTPAHPASSFNEGTTPGASQGLPEVPGLDLVQASRRMGGNTSLVLKLMQRFAQTQAQTVEQLQARLDDGDLDSATRDAHTLKGLAGNIGATALQTQAAAVEHSLRQGHVHEARALLPALADTLHSLLTALATVLQAPAEATPPPAPIDDGWQSDVAELARLLADDDARAGKCMDKLTPALQAAGQGLLTAQLKKQIARYEFEEGLDTLREIAQALNLSLMI